MHDMFGPVRRANGVLDRDGVLMQDSPTRIKIDLLETKDSVVWTTVGWTKSSDMEQKQCKCEK